jgi:type IV pilus assembly protein PilW
MRPVKLHELKHQRGLSLVELMIALVLGLFLTVVLLQIFASSKATYTFSDGLARAQENARFAMEPLKRDLRQAGASTMCAGDPITPTIRVDAGVMPEVAALLQPGMSVMGWEFDGTGADDDFDFDAEDFTVDANDWSNGIAAGLPAYLVGRVAPGSDILGLRNMGMPLNNLTGCNNNNVNSANIGTCSRANNGNTPPVSHGVIQGRLWAAVDCGTGVADVCRQTNNGNASNLNCAPGGGNTGLPPGSSWTVQYANQTEFYLPQLSYYYVGPSANGRRALFRATNCIGSGGGGGCQVEEIAEGIDSLQLFFRLDGGDELYAADSIPGNDWARVRAVVLNVVASSPDPADTVAEARSLTLEEGLVFNVDDRRVREVYTTTVALRNRITVH